jgi:hypothetical protein
MLLVATYASDAALDMLRYELADAGQDDRLGAAGRYAVLGSKA